MNYPHAFEEPALESNHSETKSGKEDFGLERFI